MNFYDNFKSRLKSKKIAVGVIGMGYVGLPLAILAAKKILESLVMKEIAIDLKC